jgi:hypothetical protein
VLSWTEVPTGGVVDLPAPGSSLGAAAEFLWFQGPSGPYDEDRYWDWQPLLVEPVQDVLGGDGPAISDCGAAGDFHLYETRLWLPDTEALSSKVVVLDVYDMDEGLAVQVDGHAVGTLSRRDAGSLPTSLVLASTAAPAGDDGTHVVRLIHLNDCAESRPLVVAVRIADDRVAAGLLHTLATLPPAGGGCEAVPPSPARSLGGLGIAIAGLLLWWAGRRR